MSKPITVADAIVSVFRRVPAPPECHCACRCGHSHRDARVLRLALALVADGVSTAGFSGTNRGHALVAMGGLLHSLRIPIAAFVADLPMDHPEVATDNLRNAAILRVADVLYRWRMGDDEPADRWRVILLRATAALVLVRPDEVIDGAHRAIVYSTPTNELPDDGSG